MHKKISICCLKYVERKLLYLLNMGWRYWHMCRFGATTLVLFWLVSNGCWRNRILKCLSFTNIMHIITNGMNYIGIFTFCGVWVWLVNTHYAITSQVWYMTIDMHRSPWQPFVTWQIKLHINVGFPITLIHKCKQNCFLCFLNIYVWQENIINLCNKQIFWTNKWKNKHGLTFF